MAEHSQPDVFEALADPTRRAILRLLIGRTLAAGDIAARFPQQRPAISKHLRVLRLAGLLDERRERQRRLYRARTEGARPLRDLLGALAFGPAEPHEQDSLSARGHRDGARVRRKIESSFDVETD